MQTMQTYNVFGLPGGLELTALSFRPNGSSAVDNTQNTGFVTSVTRAGVGIFDVVVPDIAIPLGRPIAMLNANAAGQDIIAVLSTFNYVTRTLRVNLFDVNTGAGTGALADIASATDAVVTILFLYTEQTV